MTLVKTTRQDASRSPSSWFTQKQALQSTKLGSHNSDRAVRTWERVSLHPASWSMCFYSTSPTLASVKSQTQEEKGPRTWRWTEATTWADHADGLCVCVPMMWTADKLELETSRGPGLTCKCGCRHLVFSQPLSCCESLQRKASWFLPLLLPHEGWTERAHTLCHLLSVGWRVLGWVPRSDLGGLAALWFLSSFQAFFSSWT